MQPQQYPTNAACLGLVGTLLSRQVFLWFAPHFEKNSPILNNFEAFFAAFAEAFSEHDKIRLATMKIRNLGQGRRLASIYALEFWQLSCDIDWGKQALVSQFYYGLRDEVKDLLLLLHDPSTLNEAISQAIKCNNCLFEQQ